MNLKTSFMFIFSVIFLKLIRVKNSASKKYILNKIFRSKLKNEKIRQK